MKVRDRNPTREKVLQKKIKIFREKTIFDENNIFWKTFRLS